MVIGEKFAWAHLPKTGGDATLNLFQLFPKLIVYAHTRDDNSKHDAFGMHEHEIRGKTLAMNIRRLPAWMLSYAQHEAKHGLYPDYKPLPMASPAEIAAKPMADGMLRHFTGEGRFPITCWLRMEYLNWDFKFFISNYTGISRVKKQQILENPIVNQMEYLHDVCHWFTTDQIEQMYANNPLWASLEQKVYKNIMFLEWRIKLMRWCDRRLCFRR